MIVRGRITNMYIIVKRYIHSLYIYDRPGGVFVCLWGGPRGRLWPISLKTPFGRLWITPRPDPTPGGRGGGWFADAACGERKFFGVSITAGRSLVMGIIN